MRLSPGTLCDPYANARGYEGMELHYVIHATLFNLLPCCLSACWTSTRKNSALDDSEHKISAQNLQTGNSWQNNSYTSCTIAMQAVKSALIISQSVYKMY